MTAQLRFRDLTLGYDRHPAVHHLDGAVEAGSLTAVVGPNGAGKSTLFKGVVGVIKPLAGRIERNGTRPQDIAYLPQVAEIDRSFPINVYDMVAMGLWRTKGLFGGIGRRDRDAIEHAIEAVGLTGFEQRPIGTLSGGQMQRTLFARLLLQDARVIVLDEPFNAIDAKTASDLLALVRRWHDESRTVLAALHDMELVKANFPQALLLAREPVAWGATAEVLTPENILKARRMCEAFDEQAAGLRGGGRRIAAMTLLDAFRDDQVRHSLAAVLALALSAAPIGVFLMLRRMSLVGDAMSHAILPGVAIGFLAAGLNVYAMTFGGLAAGLLVAVLAGAVSRSTALQEDASLAVFMLVSLALGVVLVTLKGLDVEQLMRFLFGETAAQIGTDKLLVITGSATVSTLAFALIYRPLALDCVDPGFLRSVSRAGGIAHLTFLALLVLNLVSAFHAFGTLLGIGIIIVPAAIARFWTRDISAMIAVAVAGALISGWIGVLIAFAAGIPTGPAVTLVAAVFYAASILFGRYNGLVWRLFPGRHLEA